MVSPTEMSNADPSPPSICLTTFNLGSLELVISHVFDSSFSTFTWPLESQSPPKLTSQSEDSTAVEPSPSVSATLWSPAATANAPELVPAGATLVASSIFVSPSTCTSKESDVSLPPTIFLTTVSCGFFVFVKVHVTVEPGATAISPPAPYATALSRWSWHVTEGAFQTAAL